MPATINRRSWFDPGFALSNDARHRAIDLDWQSLDVIYVEIPTAFI